MISSPADSFVQGNKIITVFPATPVATVRASTLMQITNSFFELTNDTQARGQLSICPRNENYNFTIFVSFCWNKFLVSFSEITLSNEIEFKILFLKPYKNKRMKNRVFYLLK